jgi:hypothetical protein
LIPVISNNKTKNRTHNHERADGSKLFHQSLEILSFKLKRWRANSQLLPTPINRRTVSRASQKVQLAILFCSTAVVQIRINHYHGDLNLSPFF